MEVSILFEVFQFEATEEYNKENIKDLNLNTCNFLSEVDADVTKFTTHDITTLLNDDVLDTTNCFFKIFHTVNISTKI